MHLTLITGPMFAGKSTLLLKQAMGKTLLVTHSLDTQKETHGGIVKPAMRVSSFKEIPSGYDTVLIDECQFFTSIEGIMCAPRVIVAGLNGDYQQKEFGIMSKLIPMADKIVHLVARCACGKDAPFTKRTSTHLGSICPEADYVPSCRQCL